MAGIAAGDSRGAAAGQTADGGNPATYAILDEQDFKIFDFDGNVVKEAKLG